MKYCNIMLATLAMALSSAPAFAHHSTNGVYDETKEVELVGTVKQWRYINPHPSLLVEVTDANGETAEWDVSYGGSAVAHLNRRGYTASTFKPGDRIKLKGAPARLEGAHGLLIHENPTHEDGSPYVIRPNP